MISNLRDSQTAHQINYPYKLKYPGIYAKSMITRDISGVHQYSMDIIRVWELIDLPIIHRLTIVNLARKVFH